MLSVWPKVHTSLLVQTVLKEALTGRLSQIMELFWTTMSKADVVASNRGATKVILEGIIVAKNRIGSVMEYKCLSDEVGKVGNQSAIR